MENSGNCLAIDLGTSGLKIAFVSKSAEILAERHATIELKQTVDGSKLQDPNKWWELISNNIKDITSKNPELGNDTKVISITGQWGSSIPVGDNSEALYDCILWMDTRAHIYSREVMGTKSKFSIEGYRPLKVLSFLKKTAGAPALEGNDPLGQYLLLKNELSEIYKRTKVILEPVDFLGLKFTGKAVATPASMILSWLVDIKKLDNPKYDGQLTKLSGRDPKKLPTLVKFPSVVSKVTEKLATELGISPQAELVTGSPDLISGAIGSGAVSDYEGHLAVSTTSWISCHVPFKKTDPFRQIATVPSSFPKKYLLANNHETAGLCLSWLRDKILNQTGESFSFRELDNIAESSPPGANGVIFTPWLSGERCPIYDRDLRASFLNLSLSNNLNDIIMATFEGVAFNARWMLDAVERMLKRKLNPIRIIGGGAISDIWCQIHANVLNREIEQVKDPLYANVKGAALLGFYAKGEFLIDDIKARVKIANTFKPDPMANKIYEKLYSVFKKIYRSQKHLYKELNA